MQEKNRKDSIYVRKNQKGLNIYQKKLEKIEYMQEKTRKDSIYVRKKLETIQYM